jgi:hypothetical protein
MSIVVNVSAEAAGGSFIIGRMRSPTDKKYLWPNCE